MFSGSFPRYRFRLAIAAPACLHKGLSRVPGAHFLAITSYTSRKEVQGGARVRLRRGPARHCRARRARPPRLDPSPRHEIAEGSFY